MHEVLRSASLMLALLNPFLVIIYLVDLLDKLDSTQFRQVLLRAGLIASVVFGVFAILGDAIFSQFFHADFASFQIFGGLIFLLIAIQFVFNGPKAISILRGESQHLAGAVAMPVLIGPGTISASVVIGKQHDATVACALIFLAVVTSIGLILALKALHDVVRPRTERLVERYIEISGRIAALFIGTVSVEMIMTGARTWADKF